MATLEGGTERIFGLRVKRREDPRFLTGRGRFVDDITLPGTTYAAFVRSPFAHARIEGIDTSAARGLPGVHAVLTGADLQAAGVGSIPTAWVLPDYQPVAQPALAIGKVNHVGEAVAVVIADTPYLARDAAERVDVRYEALDPVVDAEVALRPESPALHGVAPDNACFHWSIGDAAATESAFASATHVVRQRLINQRLIANAIEPRGSIARYDPATEELTLWVTSQNPHVHRLVMGAFVLGIPEHRFRVVAPDVGGAFGSKIFIYPEEVVVAHAARTLGRPVKWTAERRESYVTDAQGRDHSTEAEMALDANGIVLGLRVRTVANLGAYLKQFAPAVPTWLYGPLLSGQYRISAIHCEVTGVYTNTTPVDAYRGAGRPEACYVVEHMMDLAARQLGLDPAELRRRNFIGPEEFPYQTPVALVYDSGNYPPALERALEVVDYAALREEQQRLRAQGRYLGIGLSSYIEACGSAPSALIGAIGGQAGQYESSVVRVHPTGKVTVLTGTHSHGQGHETTFAQLVAEELGVTLEDVEIVHGDSGRGPFGWGTYASRSGAVGATSIFVGLQKVKDKAKRIAAHLLEAAPEDVEFAGGTFWVKGSPDRAKAFGEVVLMAYLAHDLPPDMEPGLEATTFFDPANFVYPFGTHVAVVEVDRDTGRVDLRRYLAVDDVGNVINPLIVDGQVHGGVAQGVAQALWEEAVYDEEGQLLTGSLMEYGIPRASQLPFIETERTVTPSPVNPLGVKGVGEAGAIASTAAVANAVMDALQPFGIQHIDLPLTPAKLWRAMEDASSPQPR